MQGSHDGFISRVLPAQRHALRVAAVVAATAIPTFALVTTALASDAPGGAKGSDAIFIAELGLLLLVGRLMGEAAQRIGQPAVMGQLVGGLLLGPSVFGLIWPSAQHLLFPGVSEQKSMIGAVSELGILMLLLLTGMETDLQLVRRVGRAAVAVSAAGVALPFACGFALGEFLPAELLPKPDARLVTSIFLGTALSISSVKIVAVVVRDMNFMRRDLGQIIVASAILEDTIGWVIVAVAFGLASAGSVDLWTVARAVLGTALFMGVSFTLGRRVVFSAIRWTNDYFESEFAVITVILLIMIGMALITDWIGVKDVLGAFVAGILVGESPILTRHIDEQLRGLITALFMPVFFGLAGLSANLTVLRNPELALLTVGLIAIASVGKFTGAFLGGTVGGLSRAESLALGCAMNARGSTEVIVATVGLSMGVLSQNLFTLIVTMAFLTTMAMPPMLRWALRRLPLNRKERQRLKREELDAKGFVVNLERLLLAADNSANGKFASRLAGVIAGSGGKPTTIIEFENGRGRKKGGRPEAVDEEEPGKKSSDDAAHDVTRAAEGAKTLDSHPDEEKPGKVDVIRRSPDSEYEAITEEAERGHDFLIIGIGRTRDSNGGFTRDLSEIARRFDGPIAVVDSHLAKSKDIRERRGRILLPVNGTEVSRRAADVAMTLARANDAHVTALFVTRAAASTDRRHAGLRRQAARRNEQAVLKDIATLAERYGVTVRNTAVANGSPDEAILREAKRGYDLIVLGVSRRPGDTLYFGNTASSILDRSNTSNLFVAS